ncbi:MAG: hypothetical protein HXY30_12180 [Pseudorhodoplanes sp.]|nr:hypothetical protein [Pseudorhodoplanes sp.]
MPQVWLTYQELGNAFNCDPGSAREATILNGWSRRRCSDGLTRVKLPPATAHQYMIDYAREASFDQTADRMVADLRDVLRAAGMTGGSVDSASGSPHDAIRATGS